MGEYADMMLDGTMCCNCGEYLGGDEGYPVSCDACLQDEREEKVSSEDGRLKVDLGYKLYNTLKTSAYTNQGTMYPNGAYWDDASKQFARLEQLGFVEQFQPHNHMHKPRAIITNLGSKYLELNKKKFRRK